MGAGSAGITFVNYLFILGIITVMCLNLRSFHLFDCEEPRVKNVFITHQETPVKVELAYVIVCSLLICSFLSLMVRNGGSIGIANTIFSGLLVISGTVIYIMSVNAYEKFRESVSCQKYGPKYTPERDTLHKDGKIVVISFSILTFLMFLAFGKSQTS